MMHSHTTFYHASYSPAVALPPHVGRVGDLWGIRFPATGYTFTARQDRPKRSARGGNGVDLDERSFARGVGRGWFAKGRAAVECWLIHARQAHGRRHGRAGRHA